MKLLDGFRKQKIETYMKLVASGYGEKLAQEAADLTYRINILSTTLKDHNKDKDLKAEFDKICEEG